MPTPNENFRMIEKVCLVCGVPLKLNNSRDILRKNYCSHYCSSKHQALQGKTKRPPLKKKIRPDKYCDVCKKKITNTSQGILCRTCFNKAKTKNVEIKCVVCGGVCLVKPHYLKISSGKYCSRECYFSGMAENRKYVCMECGEEVERFPSQLNDKVFCSARCRGAWLSKVMCGRMSPAYIDGRTPVRKIIRGSAHYSRWKVAVLKKDAYMCVRCGAGGRLHAHHKKSFSSLLGVYVTGGLKDDSMFWDTENGESLCLVCHQQKHPDRVLRSL